MVQSYGQTSMLKATLTRSSILSLVMFPDSPSRGCAGNWQKYWAGPWMCSHARASNTARTLPQNDLFSRTQKRSMAGRAKPFRDGETARQIVDAARAIAGFCQGITLDEFRHDRKTWSATQYQILIIGEATCCLSDAFIAAHPEIPWRDIKDMRNLLAHAYDVVRLDIVWETATRDVPPLRVALEPLLARRIEAEDEGS